MKLNKISILMLSAVALASCSDINDQNPASSVYTLGQVQETNAAIEARAEASFNGMFTMMGVPYATYGSSSGRADDFGYISASFSNDVEASDVVLQNSGYNWFSVCCEYTSRTANYANPYMRYKLPYNQIGVCNDLIAGQTDSLSNITAQCKAMRAFAYMTLAQNFAFSCDYQTKPDSPCIPLLTDGVDYTNNPRASVKQVYDYIIKDLTDAIAALEKNPTNRGTDKTRIDINVAYGLRARAELAVCKWADAAEDAEKAREGYEPAEITGPAFCDMSEPNWMWAIQEDAGVGASYATSASWIGSFSGSSYSAACQCYACINNLLYAKIPESDVRKGWWVDEGLYSKLLDGQTWTCSAGSASGQDIATYAYDDKTAFLPYTNVKFGMKSGIGSSSNNNDWPLMRVEEMYLIEAEGLAKSGDLDKAELVLEELMKYRDPEYTVKDRNLSLEDEIWFQRRVELWGEGFGTYDIKRLDKPVVRFHAGQDSNWPDAYQINIPARNGWLNLRFSVRETDNNKGIVDNTEGSLPVAGDNGNLRDGVTD